MKKERWYVQKTLEIAGAHKLSLPYESMCSRWHGHNWIIDITVTGTELNACGMLVDFAKIKTDIHNKLDHQNLNEVLPDINPTAENIARWIANEIDEICENDCYCCEVKIRESSNNLATYQCTVD